MFIFKRLREEHLEQVLEWRIKPEVAKFLFTRIENDLSKQRLWFENISKNENYRYWVIYYQDQPIGVINLSELDFKNKRCNAGYYIGEQQFNHLGGMVLPYLYNHVFNELGLKKIYGEVVNGNKILKLHLLHGYKHIGTYTEHINIENKFHDVHIVELLASEWTKKKRYHSYKANFE